MKQDRFLLVILAGIGLLIIVAIALFFVRQNSQTYGPDDTPEGVLRNYVLAINQEDYARAYDYLLETDTKPDFERFQRNLSRKTSIIDRTALKIISVDQIGNEAEIEVILSREGVELFDTRYSTQRTVKLVLQDGVWKLSSMPYPFGY
jgi:hypothetical protein